MRADIKCLRQGGFSLLEVLIALVVLGTGLISLAKFQGTVLQDNDLARARSVAAQLAEQKLEDLRGFTTLDSFSAIKADEGGRLPSGSISSTELANSNVTYTRTWEVKNYCFPARNSAAAEAAADGANCRRPTIPDFKNITVKVTWVDKDGEVSASRGVTLATSIAALDPANSGRVIQVDARRPVNSCNELFIPQVGETIFCQ